MSNKIHVNRPLGERIESFVEQNHRTLFYGSLLLLVLFGLALFNLRINEGGDDSAYISRAMDLLSEGRYPSYQGPLYPIFLAVVMAVTGYKLALLKFTSLLFIVAGHYILYKALRSRISYTLLFTTLILTSVNCWYLFFASQTYSEAMFILIQNLFVLQLIKYVDSDKTNSLKQSIVPLLSIAFMVLLAFLSRTAGLGLGIAGLVTLLVMRRYRDSAVFSSLVVILLVGWLGVRSAVWPVIPNSGKQLQELMQKHPYDKGEGEENFGGFVQRFVDNSHLYLSKHFVKMVGLKKSDSKSTNTLAVIILYALFFYGLYLSFKYDRAMLVIGIYLMVMLSLTFVSLQKLWDQYRLIIPYFPLMILFVSFALRSLLQRIGKGRYYIAFCIIAAVSFISSAAYSLGRVDSKVLISNMHGDKYNGYTPDWENYLRMSEYVGQNLSATDYVACRKPDMSRLYAGGKKFYGIFRFDSEDADELLDHLREKNVTHIILGSLRKNPEINNGEVINTLHRYMSFIAQKYPNIFVPVYQQGNVEPAYLFYIDYSVAETQNSDLQ